MKIRIMGIDPGLRYTGWGVIDYSSNKFTYIASGVCHSSGKDLSYRLSLLYNSLSAEFSKYTPDQVAIEHIFVNKDAVNTLKLAHARGIAMLIPANHGISVSEYAPNKVKKAVAGVGHADKEQVQHMLKVLLPNVKFTSADEADALAVAICHAWYGSSVSNLAKLLENKI